MVDFGTCADCGKSSRNPLARKRCRTCYPKHIQALKLAGEYRQTGGPGSARSAAERFLDQIAAGWGGCWVWTGHTHRGYGKISSGRSMRSVHRVAYEALVGAIPEGLELDHVCHTRDLDCPGGTACRHRRCCNPAHLEPVTPTENKRRGRSFSGINASKAHCLRGHEYTPENTQITAAGTRHCRECIPIWSAQGRDRNRDEIRALARRRREAKALAEGRELRLPTYERTHCPQGHAYDEANTKLINGQRRCRECARANSRAYRARKRAERKPS